MLPNFHTGPPSYGAIYAYLEGTVQSVMEDQSQRDLKPFCVMETVCASGLFSNNVFKYINIIHGITKEISCILNYCYQNDWKHRHCNIFAFIKTVY